MRFFTIVPLLLISIASLHAQSNNPSPVNTTEFAKPPEILGSGELEVESYLALIKDIHDHGPDRDDPVLYGHDASDFVHAEAGAGIRVGISDNVEMVMRVRGIEWSSDGFNYVNDRREIFARAVGCSSLACHSLQIWRPVSDR